MSKLQSLISTEGFKDVPEEDQHCFYPYDIDFQDDFVCQYVYKDFFVGTRTNFPSPRLWIRNNRGPVPKELSGTYTHKEAQDAIDLFYVLKEEEKVRKADANKTEPEPERSKPVKGSKNKSKPA